MNHYPPILLFCVLSLFNFSISASEETEDEQHSIQIIDGQAVIRLDRETQLTSGIETQILKQIEFQTESVAYGEAISSNPLLSILNQYLSASAKQAGAKARLFETKKTITRLRNLHKNKAISTQKLQNQQSEWKSAKAIYDEMLYKSKLIINRSQLQWGEILTQWATGRHSPQFKQILEGKLTLLKVTLPAEYSPSILANTIFINSAGNREKAINASLISILPTVDKFSQGQQYIFLADSSKIKPGMNFTAWIPKQQKKLTGIIIPKSALVWHLGQAFIFIKADEEHFIHQNISNPFSVPNGYFIEKQLVGDKKVVTKGAQTLLSHEFRSQIPDEDDD